MKSKWKLSKVDLNINDKFVGKMHKRSVVIQPNYVGLYMQVSRGNKINFVEVKSNMVGYHLGDFVQTKKIGLNVHKLHKKSSGYRKKKLKK